jgi:hypothetical protein
VRILDKETRKGGQRHRCHKIQDAKASFWRVCSDFIRIYDKGETRSG